MAVSHVWEWVALLHSTEVWLFILLNPVISRFVQVIKGDDDNVYPRPGFLTSWG